MGTRWRFPRLRSEPVSVCGVMLQVDESGFVVGEVSPEQHAWLAAVRFEGPKGWELVTVPTPAPAAPPPPITPALVAEPLAPESIPEPAPVVAAPDNTKTRKRGRT